MIGDGVTVQQAHRKAYPTLDVLAGMVRGRWLIACLLVTAGLTGCIGGEDVDEAPPEADGELEATATDTRQADGLEPAAEELDPEDRIEGPSWEVGQWFGYHVFFGVNDTEGRHYDTAVVDASGDSWLLAPADPELSKIEALEDLPFLGPFSKQDLSTTAGGDPFQWYDWPLFDGKTWTDTTELFGEPLEVTFNVTYAEAISTSDGDHPGFEIIGTTSEGEPFLEYDYVPHIGWFAHLFLYQVDGEPDDDPPWEFHIMTMGAGMNWTGTAYVDEATVRLSHFNGMAPPFFVDPNPHSSFTISEEATHMVGFAWTSASGGVHDTALVDPEGNITHYDAVAPPFSFSFASAWILQPAVPGQWEIATAGAGQWSGGGAFIAETIETTYQLEDGEPVEG